MSFKIVINFFIVIMVHLEENDSNIHIKNKIKITLHSYT